jgi:plasmid stabilization system protein ParE
MKLRLLKLAQTELDDAFAWYQHQADGLGYEFLDEIDLCIHRLMAYPDSCAQLEPELRRAMVNRFPYGIVYGQDGDWIVIVAIAHLHREPRYWIGRSLITP